MIPSWDVATKPFSKWRPFTILNFWNVVFLSRDMYPNTIMLLCTKFRVNRTTDRWDIAIKLFSIWRPSAILSLQNFDSLSRDRSWTQSLRQHTKFHWIRMIPGWDIAIKPFSKWRPSAILNFRKLVFWSCGLYPNVIMLLYTKFRINEMRDLGAAIARCRMICMGLPVLHCVSKKSMWLRLRR